MKFDMLLPFSLLVCLQFDVGICLRTSILKSLSGRDLSLRQFTDELAASDEQMDATELRKTLKSKLFAACAACDRGFSALPTERKAIGTLVDELKALSPERIPTKNIYPNDKNLTEKAPLEAAWRMIYTSALDVLSLNANPVAQVQGIYQLLYRNGTTVNVINLAPRLQSFFPVRIVGEGTILRLKVYIKAGARTDTRVGLSFREVEVKPISIFSQPVPDFLPAPRVSLPQSFFFGNNGDEWFINDENSPGYFDVLYLDEECLIIQQANPGGIFISVRSSEPMESFL